MSKSRYESVLFMPNFTGVFYFVPNFLSAIVVTRKCSTHKCNSNIDYRNLSVFLSSFFSETKRLKHTLEKHYASSVYETCRQESYEREV